MPRPRHARIAVAAAILLSWTAVPAAADDPDPLSALRHAHAGRLAEFGAEAKDARLGSLALRAFEEALALDPEQDAARTALGWKRGGATWTPPDPRATPGAGWPDDGEADLGRLAKREATLDAEWVKDLGKAAAAMRSRGAPAEAVERVLWGAVAVDPRDVATRRALNHVEEGGRWLAPETRAVLAAAAADARDDDRWRAMTVPLVKADALPAMISGWPQGVPAGVAAPTAGSAYSVTDPAFTSAIATALERARRFLDELFPASETTAGLRFTEMAALHVGARDLANGIVDADPTLDPATKAALHRYDSGLLGATGYTIVVADRPALALDAAVGQLVLSATAGTDGVREGTRWLGHALAYVTTRRILGTYMGYGAAPGAFGGETVPVLRTGERLDAYLRRLVALGADTPLESIASKAVSEWRPRDVAKAGALLDWLLHRDRAKGRVFVTAYLSGSGSGAETAARLAAAARAAGFDSAAAIDEAWRRFAVDAYPESERAAFALAREPWKVTKLLPAKAQPAALSLYVPPWKPVSGFLLVGGRTWTCAVTEEGKAVQLNGLRLGQPPRVVRDPGVHPFYVPSEYGKEWLDLHVALARVGTGWAVRSAEAFTGTIEGAALTFLDLDLDGREGGFDRDGYVVGSGAYALPLSREIVLGSRSIEIRRVGPDGREIAWRSHPLSARGKDLEALLRLNAWRVASGVPALPWDADGSIGASLHADYLAAVFPGGVPAGEERREDPSKTGSTPAGRAFAPLAAVAAGTAPAAVVDRLLAGIRERALLLDPDARCVATGQSGGVGMVALAGPESSELPSEFRGPAIFPPPSGEGIPTRLAPESQVRLADVPEAGCPITLQFRRGEDLDALSLDVALTTAAGARVDLVRLDPKTHAAALEGTAGMVVFVPILPLARGTVYRLVAAWARGAKREDRAFTFRTGSL